MAYVVIGLGNPGAEYAGTRHNAGRMAVELFCENEGFPAFTLRASAHALVSDGRVGDVKVVAALPETYMNTSGKTAAALVRSVPAAKKLLVVRDDLDLPLGTIKMTMYGRGAGGHKGVESIARALKTKEFAQLKIGIAPTTPSGRMKKVAAGDDVVEHVVSSFKPKEKEALEASFTRAAQATRIFIEKGIEEAMLFANTKV